MKIFSVYPNFHLQQQQTSCTHTYLHTYTHTHTHTQRKQHTHRTHRTQHTRHESSIIMSDPPGQGHKLPPAGESSAGPSSRVQAQLSRLQAHNLQGFIFENTLVAMQSTIPHDAAADISPDDEKIGQLSVPDDEDFNVDRVKSLGNGTVSSLMNDIVLPGYADHTIRRLGLGPYPGLLHTTIKLAMGLYVKPTITVQFAIRNRSKAFTFAFLVIPLEYTGYTSHCRCR